MTPERILVPFRHWHYDWLLAAAGQTDNVGSLAAHARLLEQENSWTGVVDGVPVFCAGTIRQWAGRHLAWAFVNRGTLPHLEWMTQITRANLSLVRGRVETTVRVDFAAGHRWAKQLGFRVETPLLEAYGPEGEDHVGYVRVKS